MVGLIRLTFTTRKRHALGACFACHGGFLGYSVETDDGGTCGRVFGAYTHGDGRVREVFEFVINEYACGTLGVGEVGKLGLPFDRFYVTIDSGDECEDKLYL